MNSIIFWCSIEYEYTSQSPQSGHLTGGFVYAFAKAHNLEETLSKVTKELKHRNFQVKVVEFISPYEIRTEWETEEQTNHFQALYKQAEVSHYVIFDTFYAYEAEE